MDIEIEKKENENIRKQILEIAEKNGIKLSESMLNNIINESYFLRNGGIPESERVPDVKVQSIEVHRTKENGDASSVSVMYSSDNASYKDFVFDSITYFLRQDWWESGYQSSDEYFDGDPIIDHNDKLEDIMEDIDDVQYRNELFSFIDEWGCQSASGRHLIENAEKDFVKNIINKKGIYDGVLFLMLKNELFHVHEPSAYKEVIPEVMDTIFEYTNDNTLNGIEKFLNGLENSGLSQEYIDFIKDHHLDEEFMDIVRNQEQSEIIPGHQQITVADIKRAMKTRDISNRQDRREIDIL